LHYAQITRADEAAEDEHYRGSRGPTTWKSIITDRFSKGRVAHTQQSEPGARGEKQATNANTGDIVTSVTEAEWKQASRAIRSAGWGGVFYLITTDILGPFSTP
jgi:hypothetical protein